MSKLVNHQRNDDAVSPVIGVMLMIVVTVVIAAVVALFATNVVTSTEAAPVVVMDMNAYSSSSDENSKLVMSTRGGDPLDLTKLKVVVSDSTDDYGLSFVGLDQKGVGDHLEIGEKLTVFTLENIETAASSATGGEISEVAGIIKSAFVVGNKIHVMVTFNENAVIYEKDIIIKAGAESQTAEVTEVLKTSTAGKWVYQDDTPVTSSNAFTITYGTTEVSIPVTNDSTFMGILFSKGLEGSKVENDSCVVGMNVDGTDYEFQVNSKTLTSTTVLKKGDMISVVKKTQPTTGPTVSLSGTHSHMNISGYYVDGEDEIDIEFGITEVPDGKPVCITANQTSLDNGYAIPASGWVLPAIGEVERNSCSFMMPASSVIVTANESTITRLIFDENAEGAGAPKYAPGANIMTYGEAAGITFTTASEYTGHALDGWYNDSTGTTKVLNADGSVITGGVSGWYDASGNWTKTTVSETLYAKWTPTTYTVNFSVDKEGSQGHITATANGKSISNGDSVAAGSEVVFTLGPEKTGVLKSFIVNTKDVTEQVEKDNTYTIGSLGEDITAVVRFTG